MRTLIVAAALIASGCDSGPVSNNGIGASSDSQIPGREKDLADRRHSDIKGLRFICFGFDVHTMTEATVRGLIEPIERMRGAYQDLGIRLSHQLLTTPGQAPLRDDCRPPASSEAGAEEILLVSIAGDGNGTRLSFRRGERLENIRDSHEPRIWLQAYLNTRIGRPFVY